MKVALVHEWLTIIGGSEKVFKEIASLFPGADIYTLVSQKNTVKQLGFENNKVQVSFIQNLPFSKTKYRYYLPLFPIAVEQFDLTGYDLIISSSHAVAKGVLTNSNQVHICYCHSPIRYAWDLYHQYLKDSGLNNGMRGFVAKYILHRIRVWDIISSNRVDYFIANSDYIRNRIKKIYNRDSFVIYPNVAVEDFRLVSDKQDFYVTCSRFVQYKKMDLIVKAFAEMPEKKLYVIGDGPDLKRVKKFAKANTILLGSQPFEVLNEYLGKARAFVFAAEEDFGMLPVEAQACGTPVIAFGKGGVLESVIENFSGVFFNEQSVDSIRNAIDVFEKIENTFDHEAISKHAANFSTARFKAQIKAFVENKVSRKKNPVS